MDNLGFIYGCQKFKVVVNMYKLGLRLSRISRAITLTFRPYPGLSMVILDYSGIIKLIDLKATRLLKCYFAKAL